MRISLLLLAVIFSNGAFAQQLPVRLEPRHRNLFENERVRVLDVRFAPGDTTLYHLHATPSIFVRLSDTRTGSQLYGGAVEYGDNKSGDISYDALSTPRYHRVWNADKDWFHVMDIELPGKPSGVAIPPIQGDGIIRLFSEPQANGFRLQPRAGERIQIPASASGYLLISLGNADMLISSADGEQHRIMSAGHYEWLTGKGLTTLTLKDAAGLALIQLK
jgi:hypothetical protein